jgi:hypothetical protein
MDMTTRSSQAAAAVKAVAPVLQPENIIRSEVREEVRNDRRNAVRNGPDGTRKSFGFGMPCANCRLYYPANLDFCPTCNGKERVSPNVAPVIAKSQAVIEDVPDTAVVEQEREAFLKEFKSQLFAAHAEVANSPIICTLGEHHAQGAEPASICKPCYDQLQERVDVCEAALHMDVKDAAQIVYEAVWADPSDPSKTYTNAAMALLTELRKRAGVSSMIGPFQPLGN